MARNTRTKSVKAPIWLSGLMVLIALLPLPFGGNRPWASDLFGLWCGVLLLTFAVTVEKPLEFFTKAPTKLLMASLALICGFLVWSWVQSSSLLPTAWQHPLWHLPLGLGWTQNGSVSVEPDTLSESFIRIVGYVICFLLSFAASREASLAKRILKTVFFASFAYALYGLGMQMVGGDYVLWYKKWVYSGDLTSTFINRNSFATYDGLGLLCALAMLWQHIKNVTMADSAPTKRAVFAAWLKQFNSRDAFYCLAPVLLFAALILTASRAGLASVLIGVLVFALALGINRKWSLGLWIILGLFLAGAITTAFVLGGETMSVRTGTDQLHYDTGLRLNAYKQAITAIEGNPILGFGLGSFDNAFRIASTPNQPLWFQHAHNDYLELALEAGVPAAIAYIVAVLLMVFCCVRGVIVRRRFEFYPALALGASALVGVHGCFDFSLQIPAVAATYAVLLGMGVAQSSATRKDA